MLYAFLPSATLGAPALKTCSDIQQKRDCGFVGIDQSGCEAKGCCWKPENSGNDPWCFYETQPSSKSCFVSPNAATDSTISTAPFPDDELAKMKSLFLDNVGVQGTGAVVAAPDHSTPGGSYYYHWERDGSLTMTSVQRVGFSTKDQMKAYTEWVLARQAEKDPNGQDVRTEPKYEIPSGKVYTGAWCRPQNDGPGLRAIALMDFAHTLMSGSADDKAYVLSKLWRADGSGAIQRDLAYLTDGGWSSSTCDLWEEVRNSDFLWNRITMKRALKAGAAFASAQGDEAASQKMADIESTVENMLRGNSHWNGNYLFESNNREIDGAVIVSLTMGFDDITPVFKPSAVEVASTVLAYNKAFCAEYPINIADSKQATPGVLYGRYPGDTYAGGNPWVLTSAALAQLLYRVAHSIATGDSPTASTLKVWAEALNLPSLANSLPNSEQALSFIAAADGVLARIREHVKAEGGRLDEQMDKNSGQQKSAKSLTWSYAEVFNALHWRIGAIAVMQSVSVEQASVAVA